MFGLDDSTRVNASGGDDSTRGGGDGDGDGGIRKPLAPGVSGGPPQEKPEKMVARTKEVESESQYCMRKAFALVLNLARLF